MSWTKSTLFSLCRLTQASVGRPLSNTASPSCARHANASMPGSKAAASPLPLRLTVVLRLITSLALPPPVPTLLWPVQRFLGSLTIAPSSKPCASSWRRPTPFLPDVSPYRMSEASHSIDAALIGLDGTLVHSLPDLATAANRLLHDLGQPAMPAHTLGNFVGKGSRDMVKRMLNACQLAGNTGSEEAELDDLVERFFRHYREVNGQQSEVYPGVIEGLQAFRLAGVKLAVVTNKALEFSQ